MSLYAIKDSADLADIKSKLSVSKVPTLLAFAAGQKEPQSFTGAEGSKQPART
jgi:hypothetical protein